MTLSRHLRTAQDPRKPIDRSVRGSQGVGASAISKHNQILFGAVVSSLAVSAEALDHGMFSLSSARRGLGGFAHRWCLFVVGSDPNWR